MRDKGRTYSDAIELPVHLTLSDVEHVLEKMREHGSAEWREPRSVRMTFVEDDDWDLLTILREVSDELSAYGVDWTPDKAKVRTER